MEIKLQKAYRHNYSFCNDYLDAYHCLVKVKRENPTWYPWEIWKDWQVHIQYESGMPNGKQWILHSFSDDMDKAFERLQAKEYHATKASLMNELKRIIPLIGFTFGNFEFA